jgi:hypothetical protein
MSAVRFWWCHTVGCFMYDKAVQKVIGICAICGEDLHCASVDEKANQVLIDP